MPGLMSSLNIPFSQLLLSQHKSSVEEMSTKKKPAVSFLLEPSAERNPSKVLKRDAGTGVMCSLTCSITSKAMKVYYPAQPILPLHPTKNYALSASHIMCTQATIQRLVFTHLSIFPDPYLASLPKVSIQERPQQATSGTFRKLAASTPGNLQ